MDDSKQNTNISDKPFGPIVTPLSNCDSPNHEKERKDRIKQLEHLVEERTAALKAAQQNLLKSEQLAVMGKLTATVSHELRSPLGALRASLYTIRHRCAGHDIGVEDIIARAERSVARCEGIIEELLDFTRANDPNRQMIEIDAWLAALFNEEPVPEGVRLETDFHSGANFSLDPERFRRCLINLVNNAYQAIEEKYGKSGQGVVKVASRINEGHQVEILIADNGVGIAPDQVDRIFEPLYSTKSIGVGLGVPIAQQIVEQHGGRLNIQGEPGLGTQVLIKLPPVADHADHLVKHSTIPSGDHSGNRS